MLDSATSPDTRQEDRFAALPAAGPLKIAHFNTFDIGGAAIAAARLHRSLLAAGHDSTIHLLQARGGGVGEAVRPSKFQQAAAALRPHLERLPVEWLLPRRQGKFSLAWLPNSLLQRVAQSGAADVLHLHWLGDGFIDIGGLRNIDRPIVWTLHDMWAFTGGCFYDAECGRFASGCGRCPMIQSDSESDFSSRVIRRKQKAWRDLNLTVAAPSRWMADEARRSVVFRNARIEVIPNCVDMSIFKPVDRAMARSLFNLPATKRLILFGAVKARSEPRKGYIYLEQALSHLKTVHPPEETEIVIFGEGTRNTWQQGGYTWHSLGSLHDEVSLTLAYNVADVFVAPSLQDNLPNTVVEALACATPCVAFKVGGFEDLITHMGNGYLARPKDADDLANGVNWVLAGDQARLREAARRSVVTTLCPRAIADRYVNLYSELINNRPERN